MDLILQQEDADLVPLVIDEMLIRLLRSPVARHRADRHHRFQRSKDRQEHFLAQENHATTVRIEDLVATAGMSPSSFYSHFKSITSMSPLQFQKTLRLQEARNLMITRRLDVSNASLQVGYASLSQFSREYSRLFGYPPVKILHNYVAPEKINSLYRGVFTPQSVPITLLSELIEFLF